MGCDDVRLHEGSARRLELIHVKLDGRHISSQIEVILGCLKRLVAAGEFRGNCVRKRNLGREEKFLKLRK